MKLFWYGNNTSLLILDKYETPIRIYIIMTYRFHICDMFDEMYVMAGRILVKSLLKRLAFVSMSFIISKNFMKFWVVAWVLALKRCTKFGVDVLTLAKNVHSH